MLSTECAPVGAPLRGARRECPATYAFVRAARRGRLTGPAGVRYGRALVLPALRDLSLRLWPGDADLRWSMRQIRYGYRFTPVGARRVPVDSLRVRKEPTLIAPAGADPEIRFRSPQRVIANPVDRFFPLRDGHEDRRIAHLPHLAVLRHWEANAALPADSDYARLLRVRALVQNRRLTEEAIERRMAGLVQTCASIRRLGYLGAGHRHERIVVMTPSIHPATETYRPQDWEVFDGHHRAICVVHLGLTDVEVLLIRPIRVGSFDWRAAPLEPSLWERAGPGSTATLPES